MRSRPTSLDDQSINIIWRKTNCNDITANCIHPGEISVKITTHNGDSTKTFRVKEPGNKE